jgi:hypothetical protein
MHQRGCCGGARAMRQQARDHDHAEREVAGLLHDSSLCSAISYGEAEDRQRRRCCLCCLVRYRPAAYRPDPRQASDLGCLNCNETHPHGMTCRSWASRMILASGISSENSQVHSQITPCAINLRATRRSLSTKVHQLQSNGQSTSRPAEGTIFCRVRCI